MRHEIRELSESYSVFNADRHRYIYLLSDACINCRYMKRNQKDETVYNFTENLYGVKRVIDILLSALALILLSWLFLILCIAIKIDSRGPILLNRERVGIHKTHFMIYKFRTVRIDTPKDMPTHMLADQRNSILQRVGNF